jgi:hypothetical protein
MNCNETVTVRAEAVNWLKEKYPELCIKAGLCERIAGRLYTKTFIPAPPPAAPVQAHRTDQQIVDQTEELAVWLLSWGFNRQPETDAPMRESAHPMAQRCWSAACHIQEMLTATDPENSVAELDVDAAPPAAQRQWVGLTDEDRQAAFESIPDMLEGFLKKWGWLHFSKAIEAKLREKNGGAA